MAEDWVDIPKTAETTDSSDWTDIPAAPTAQPEMTAQQRYRQTLKAYHDQGTENPDVAPGYVSPETSKAFAEAKANIPKLGAQWGDVGIGAAKGLAGGLFGGLVGDIESLGRLPFQIPGVREYIADVSPHTVIPTSEEGGYLGPRGLGAFKAPETPEEKGGAFIGSMLSPNVVSGGAKAVGKGIKHIAGQATFVGPKALEVAYSAGKEGGEAAQAFRENITKSVDLADIIPEVKSSIDNMRAARNAGYVSDMKELGKNVTPLNFDEIDKAVARSTQVKTFKGQDLSPVTTKIRQEMNDAIKEWRSLDPAEYHTPVGMDALKQKLGDLMDNTLPGTPERVAASDIYNAVRKTIIKEAPEYAPIMKAYENSSAQIKEIEKALSLGKNASADTGLRKLQSILRDNVNASYGNREQLAQYLIANGSPNLMEKLAGQALSPYTPRGLGKLAQNVGAHMAAIAAAASTGGVAPILTFMAGVPISSPRLMGNLSYLSGVAARYGEKIPAKAAIRTGILADTVTPDGTQPRATGGSVFDKMHAAKHMQEGGGLSSFLKGEYSGNKEGQHGGGYLGIESPTGNAGIGGQGWRENTPEGRLGRASITNVDVGHKIGDLNLTGSYRANQREIARPPAGDNTYFDPIEHSGQKFRMPNDIDKRFMLGLSKQFSDGGSVFDKMHAAKHMQQGGGTDAPFNEWDAVPRNAEGIPQIRIEKPPVNEADEAQAAREAAAARVAGNVRGAPYEPTPPSTEGKTWMMEPGKEAVQSGNYENTLPPNVRLNDAGIPYNVETGEELQMARRPNVLPWTRTPYGVEWAMPKIAELAGDILNPLAVTKGVALKPGEFALGSGPIKRSVLEQPNAPTFYSALDRAVSDIPQAKASAEQWAATLANRPGVKPEEIQWRGLDQYLAGRQGQTVTKQEIADHLAGNKVELGSVQKGLSRDNLRPDDVAKLEYGQRWQERVAMQEEIRAARPHDWWESPEFQSNQRVMDDLHNGMVDDTLARLGGEQTPTKYHGYQLPGGENYSEKLLTLPEKKAPEQIKSDILKTKYKALNDEIVKLPYNSEQQLKLIKERDELEPLLREANTTASNAPAPNYKSSHWDEPNPVTHMRTNERTIGNTSSHHIEEVQSDWHQKGRTEGYADPAKRDIAARELLTAESELKKQSAGQINRNYKEAIDNQVEFYANPERDVEFAEQWFGETPEQQSAALRYMAAKREFSALGGVPDAPFKKTWPDLTMKQALRDAVENGKDRLSWTPGEAQAKRYDLSQHVKEIEYIKNSDGTYRVGIADKDGEPIRSLPGIDVNRMTMAQIEATVGKEVAVKIENRAGRRYRGHDGHTLEGLDLKVGGEGMNEFYDKMLPKAVEKLGKAYGVKVQRGVDTTGNPVNYVDIPPAWKQEILKKGFPLFASGGSVFDKMHMARKRAEGGGLESFIKSLGSQGAAFGTQTEQEQAGFQRDPISELGKGAYNAVEHLAKENIDNANLLATGNRDQFSGKPGFEAGMLTMGTGAVAGVPMRAGEAVLGAGPIRAYHASPHNFDKFDLAKIGTGEGAQAYGHGIYTAESQAVSGRGGQYDKNFTQRMRAGADSLLAKNGGDVAAAEAAARAEIERLNGLPLMGNDPKRWASLLETQQNRLAALDTFKRTGEFPKSHIYEVNINAKPEQFLDWDKPLSQQPKTVQDLVSNGPSRWGGNDFVRGQLASPSGEAIYKRIATDSVGKQGYGADHNAYAADLVNKAGIPGIKYLDQGSRQFSADAFAWVQRAEAKIERLRASGETGYKLDDALQELQSAKRSVGDLSSNYVVFDPKIIEIMKKYGMTLPAATAAYEAMKTNQEKTGFKKGGSVFDKMKRASK